MNYSWFDVSQEEAVKWLEWCPPGTYRYGRPDELPDSVLPHTLTDKCDSVFVLASGSAHGVAYYMANLNRADFKAEEMEQMPLGIAFIGNAPVPSGCLVQHGNWPNRTTTVPSGFLDYVSASGLGHCYPLQELPSEPCGSIADLNIKSQNEAFKVVVAALKDYIE